MEENRQSENAALIEEMKRHEAESFKLVDLSRGSEHECQVALVPKGKELVGVKHLLDAYRLKPERKKGSTTLLTLDAFCEFVARHKQAQSVVFCDDSDTSKPKLVAVFNASGRNVAETLISGADEKGNATAERVVHTGAPDWEDHRAVYAFPVSDEWTKWTTGLPGSFNQAQFADFLEDRITDVVSPSDAGLVALEFAESVGTSLASPTQLLKLSRKLAVNVESKCINAQNLSSGEVEFVFQEQHKDEAGQPFSIPGAFAIGIPVFRCGQGYRIPVRLRYRVSGGKVTWMLAAQRLDVIFEDAIEDAMKVVLEKTDLPLFRGTP
jgi:uncharacterized protein YfdQ (DUF2303 family)